MTFNLYEFVRIKEGDIDLPGTAKVGDTAIIDSVTYHPIGWYRVSLDKDGFTFVIEGKYLERINK